MQNAAMQMGQPQRMQVAEPHHTPTIGPMEERHKASAIYQQETTVLRLRTVKDVRPVSYTHLDVYKRQQ